ncbi:chemotaxis protein [Vibrio sp. SCSIO 43135]|uniref:chemotaxis protein n=1 Tax=Vibrio sp. SCSIO 43135 TaxID=2819096 RepID=UPI0020757AB8|nr:chemotaxis protein [Vibrio sp. SCSIO 43135]USD43715.1 chemotaxis protein [Vibrio sp. SCSIO 43135]
MSNKPVFVIAAEVAAELNRGMEVAKRLLLVASNARALALRAGESAAGFRPITDSIDDLVRVTLEASNRINIQAQQLSKIATAGTRSGTAVERFEHVYQRAKGANHLDSLNEARANNLKEYRDISQRFSHEAKGLHEGLKTLYDELRIAQIISTMLSVEASQADEKYQAQLNTIADSVTQLAETIQAHVLQSLKLFSIFAKVNYAIKSTI